jgi:hypothetical protein
MYLLADGSRLTIPFSESEDADGVRAAAAPAAAPAA